MGLVVSSPKELKLETTSELPGSKPILPKFIGLDPESSEVVSTPLVEKGLNPYYHMTSTQIIIGANSILQW